MKPKTYLGDGVYAEVKPWGDVILSTEHGMIVLDLEVLAALGRYLDTGEIHG